MRKPKIKRNQSFLVAILAVVILFSGWTFSSQAFSKTNETQQESGACLVTSSQIIEYLEGFGYTNITVNMGEGPNCNRICYTDYPYNTTVYCSSTEILGHEDDPE